MRVCGGRMARQGHKIVSAAAYGFPVPRPAACTTRLRTLASTSSMQAMQGSSRVVPAMCTASDTVSSGTVQEQDSAATSAAAPAPAAAVKEFVKRSVAMHIGYVGTSYYGLQANRDLPHLSTIEGVLEKALLDAGFIKEVNYGDFRKTKWSRSSRTDKGVHSLSTVIGVRLVLKEAAFVEDPEGLAVAAAINAHLPPDICVFAVQRTNKGFDTRRWCHKRSYEYYLPASVLRLETADGSSSRDKEVLEVFQEALGMYEGTLPFHNFAGNRKQYVQQRKKGQSWAAKRNARAAASEASSDADTEQQQQKQRQQQEEGVKEQADASAAAAAAPVEAPTATTSSSEQEEDPEAVADAEERQLYAAAAAAAAAAASAAAGDPQQQQQPYVFVQECRWLDEPDPNDPLVKSHYRRMWSFTAGDPVPLVPGGVPCLKLEVTGDSFMLHQIRHMIGAAVAVARGIMPLSFLEVALSAPARVPVPRAPPHTLLLADSFFSPFPAGYGQEVPLVAQWSGERLELREGGRGTRQGFRQRVFDAVLNQALQHPDWATWSDTLLEAYVYPQDQVAAITGKHTTWLAALRASRAAAAAKAAARALEAHAAREAEAAAAAAGAEEGGAAQTAPSLPAAEGEDASS